MEDFSKFFLFIVLMLVVLLMVTNKPRPLASAPIAGDTPVDKGDSQTDADQDTVSRGPGFASQPNYSTVPPLSLCMPTNGVQPFEG